MKQKILLIFVSYWMNDDAVCIAYNDSFHSQFF